MSLSLKRVAERLGLGHRKLMQRMREKGLLDKYNLPANPAATKDFLVTRESRWFHEQHGMQYKRTTRVTEVGISWLANQIGIERPAPPAAPDPREVA
ncbi:phage antirepressor KilAC domain-containing protein [Pseudomonas fluorescens]|uniref:Phage antirepressor KilAC domain-containing protein n=1 Tax=Pseudomonas fluorescens TaxID=294 RepID=A0A7M2JCE9_PSEFL|nr:phage antirepressor KilAC domain-containing protein [Pseudomonas fluorescens]QOU06783.1 phage antirepressor KilAC domain-containing protein [Pseudomonas fluorescens]